MRLRIRASTVAILRREQDGRLIKYLEWSVCSLRSLSYSLSIQIPREASVVLRHTVKRLHGHSFSLKGNQFVFG